MGASASVIAIGGLLLNIAAGNTNSVGFGVIDHRTQAGLAWVAGAVLVLVFIKIGIRCGRIVATDFVAPDCRFSIGAKRTRSAGRS